MVSIRKRKNVSPPMHQVYERRMPLRLHLDRVQVQHDVAESTANVRFRGRVRVAVAEEGASRAACP